MRHATPLVAVLLLLLAGCSEPTIDGSSMETMQASMEEMRGDLSEERRQKLSAAVTAITMDAIGTSLDASFSGVDEGGQSGTIFEALDGMTASEIIARGDSVQAAREARQKRQAMQEIQELERKRQEASQAQQSLSQFKVKRSRFRQAEREFMGAVPVITLTVENGTGEPISRAYFEGTYQTPSRSVPWQAGTFNYEISGGLEPGEEATWNLRMNQFGEWGQTEEREGAVFTAKPYRLDGPEGEVLYVADFSESDAERLEELRAEYAN